MGVGDVEVSILTNEFIDGAIFDGIDDNVFLANNSFNIQKGSVSLWFRPSTLIDAGTEPNQVILYAAASRNFISFGTDGNAENGNLVFGYYDGAFNHILSNVVSWAANTWFHVVTAWDNVTGEKSIYVDGVLKNTATDITTIDYSSGRATRFGSDFGGSGSFFGGFIRDVNVYDRAIIAAEVLELFQKTVPSSGLISQYDFRTDYLDSVGALDGTNDGTIFGSTVGSVATAIKAARVTANDKHLLAMSGSGKQVINVNIEEAP